MAGSIRYVGVEAPLRVDLAGGFTDVPPFCEEEGGFVVNAAASESVFAVVSRAPRGNVVRVETSDRMRLRNNTPGALAAFRIALKDAGAKGVELVLSDRGLSGSGLGSSGALLVAAQVALKAFYKKRIHILQIARRARSIEVEDLGRPGGGQDPMASACGGVLAIEFPKCTRDGRPKQIQLLPRKLELFENSLLIIHLNRPRVSSARIAKVVENIQSRDRNTMETLRSMKRLAIATAAALRRQDVGAAIDSAVEHALVLRRLHPSIFGGGVGDAIDHSIRYGALGAKPCGAGGGGCVLVFIKPSRRRTVLSRLKGSGFDARPFIVHRSGLRVTVHEEQRLSGRPRGSEPHPWQL